MQTFAIVLFVVGGVLVIIAFILILCLFCRYRRKRAEKDNDLFKVVYNPKKKQQTSRLQTVDVVDGHGTLVAANGTLVSNRGGIVASNGTLVHSGKPRMVSNGSHGGSATLIPATVVLPHGSTFSVDKATKKRRLRSSGEGHRVVYAGSHLGTTTRTASRSGHSSRQQQQQQQQHRGYSSSYAYGTTGNGNVHYTSSPEMNALVLSGDVRSGNLKVLGDMPRERRVTKWLHSGGVTRSTSHDHIDADHRSLASDVFASSTGDDHASTNALKLRWSPWMDRKPGGGGKHSESESYVYEQRTLPSHYERKYINPQYTGKAMSAL